MFKRITKRLFISTIGMALCLLNVLILLLSILRQLQIYTIGQLASRILFYIFLGVFALVGVCLFLIGRSNRIWNTDV